MSDETERRLKPFFHHTLHSSMGGNLPAEAHLANQLLSGKIPSERVAALAAFLLEAARWGNERVAMQAFRWLEQAWDEWAEAYRKEYTGRGDAAFFESLRANILERCIELYAVIPEDDEGDPTCPDVKVGIIQKVARTYWEAEWTDTSTKAFAFILAMGYPVGKGNPARGPYADVRLRFAEKRYIRRKRWWSRQRSGKISVNGRLRISSDGLWIGIIRQCRRRSGTCSRSRAAGMEAGC